MLILFFSAFIVLLSIQIHFCEELSIEIGSYLAQSSVFENLAEYPPIPVETGVWDRQDDGSAQLFQLDMVDFESATCTIPTSNNCNFKTNKGFLVR